MGRVGGMDQMSLSVPLRNSDLLQWTEKQRTDGTGSLSLSWVGEGQSGGGGWGGVVSLFKIPDQGQEFRWAPPYLIPFRTPFPFLGNDGITQRVCSKC